MKQILTLFAAGALTAACCSGLLAQPSGQWDFNSASLAATTGQPMEYLDGATQTGTRFGTTAELGVPDIGGQSALVMGFPSNAVGMGFLVPTPPTANGGGGGVNDWTVLMDVLWPTSSHGAWRALMDVDGGLINPDADLFVNAGNALGVGTYYGTVQANTWHRLGIVVNISANRLRFYIDGVEVGSRDAGNASALDGRWALFPASVAYLFYDNDGETAAGYLNSLQLWPVALSAKQMLALGAPQAAGLPAVIPPVPSSVDRWIPAGAAANRNTDVGVILDAGSTTIQDSSISLTLDGVAVASPQITRNGTVITVRKANAALFDAGSQHTLTVTYTDSLAGQKTATHTFLAALLFEDFEGLVLGNSVNEQPNTPGVWTNVPPAGWVTDNTGTVGYDQPGVGVTEWKGWGFANKEFWVTVAGDQTRSEFTKGKGTVAIADPDEWDDLGDPKTQGTFNAILTTPSIPLTGVGADSVFIRFDSSWRPEGFDDPPAQTNNQTGIVWVSYDGGAFSEVMRWDSQEGGDFFHPDSQNETVLLNLNNPAGATSMTVRFGLLYAGNDWWWAFDNLEVNAGATAPSITRQPASQLAYAGSAVSFEVTTVGTEPLSFRWLKDGDPVGAGAAARLDLANVQAAAAGDYRVVITNIAGAVTSLVARLDVFAGPITEALVTHLEFEDAVTDSSGRGNHGTAQGSPSYVTGKVGARALRMPTRTDYVTLGTPPDLNFGTATDFTVSFWAKSASISGDPSWFGNKDWNSGGNPGYVIASDDDGRIQWNLAGAPGGRKDYDSSGGKINDGAWHHIALTFQRNRVASTYLDGALIQDTSNPTSLSANENNLDTASGLTTCIGQDGTGSYGSGFTDLEMDDVGIWRRALTPQELAAIYQAGQEGKDLKQAAVAASDLGMLTLQRQGDNVVLQWTDGAGVKLQKTSSLTSPVQWNDVPGAGTATEAIGPSGAFYRLIKP